MVQANPSGNQTPQTTVTGGIHTNDTTTVKQYFNYYAKLANQ